MMTRKILNCTVMLLFCALIFNVLAAPPMPPCAFYGYAYVGGKPAQDGLNVTAVISGTTLTWATETKNGTYGWPLKGSSRPDGFWIPSDDPETSEKDGGVTGNIIIFYIDGQLVGQTATFESGGAKRIDLSISTGALNPSLLTITLDCPTAYEGYKVTISGRLVDTNGLGISGASLLATYATSGGSWKDIASFNTTINGNYNTEWTPSSGAGNYTIKVSWEGSQDFDRTDAYTNLAVTPLEEKYVFSVISNSTISELAFDSTNKILSFTVEGPSGSTGYSNVLIAKSLITEITGLKIYLDGNETPYTASSSDTAWLLRFTYQQSTHIVTVNLGQSPAPFIQTPFGIATLVGVAIVIAIVAIFALRVRRRHAEEAEDLKAKSQKNFGKNPRKRDRR